MVPLIYIGLVQISLFLKQNYHSLDKSEAKESSSLLNAVKDVNSAEKGDKADEDRLEVKDTKDNIGKRLQFFKFFYLFLVSTKTTELLIRVCIIFCFMHYFKN